MSNQFLNAKASQENIREELQSISQAKLIMNLNSVMEFLLEVRRNFFPDQALTSWGELTVFRAEDLSASELAQYGLTAETTGWHYLTTDNTVYSMEDEVVQELAHHLLFEFNQKDVFN